MLKLVHEYLNKTWDETGLSLERIRQNIMDADSSASISVSKLHRIFSDPNNKVSLEDLIQIVRDGFKRNPQELLAIIGEQEYVASKEVGYKGVSELIEEFERREVALRDHYEDRLEKEAVLRHNIHEAFIAEKDSFKQALELMETTYNAALKKRDETYERSVGHLKKQLIEKDDAILNAEAKFGAAIKSVKWWRFTAIVTSSVLTVAFAYLIWEITHFGRGATAILIQLVKEGLI